MTHVRPHNARFCNFIVFFSMSSTTSRQNIWINFEFTDKKGVGGVEKRFSKTLLYSKINIFLQIN